MNPYKLHTFEDGTTMTLQEAIGENIESALTAVGARVPPGWTLHMAKNIVSLIGYFDDDLD